MNAGQWETINIGPDISEGYVFQRNHTEAVSFLVNFYLRVSEHQPQILLDVKLATTLYANFTPSDTSSACRTPWASLSRNAESPFDRMFLSCTPPTVLKILTGWEDVTVSVFKSHGTRYLTNAHLLFTLIPLLGTRPRELLKPE